jgi:organic hydroperoxide reductase OsmC/OhrA
MAKKHHYKATIVWEGNEGTGTSQYNAYNRNHSISINEKVAIAGSSDPAFRGDKSKHNPEDLLLSSLSACHMLWYLYRWENKNSSICFLSV